MGYGKGIKCICVGKAEKRRESGTLQLTIKEF